MKPKITLKSRQRLPNRPHSALVRRPRSVKSKIVLGLLIIIASGSILLLLLPYIPSLTFWITRPSIDASPYQQAAQATRTGQQSQAPTSSKPGNRLILPSIGVDTQIIDGKDLNVIGKNQGVWRETPQTNPDEPGNVVIAGHRFLYTATNGGWFYHLPELKVGQKIYVRWDDSIYEYEVYNTRSVLPTQVDIRDNDPRVPHKLTLYTCYPLGSTAKRYVVEAKRL